MFGWEFPPFISGGLGTACKGIAKGLTANNVELVFVLPTKRKQDIVMPFKILAADELPAVKLSEKLYSFFRSRKYSTEVHENVISPYYTAVDESLSLQDYLKFTSRETDSEITSLLDFTGNYGKNLMKEVAMYADVASVIASSESHDVIHAHDWLTYPAGCAAKEASGKPLIVHVHATEFDRSGEHVNQEVYEIERMGMHKADKIIAVSYYTKNIIVTRYGINPEKVAVVHNAVDKGRQLERYRQFKDPEEKIILFLGRITMQKGPEYFIEAAEKVLKKIAKVRFVMAGSGDMFPRMITLMAEKRMEERFHFTGFLRGMDVEKMYAMSDLYVMPSVSEPFGISPFEALNYDIPVIISKQSGIAEILHCAVKIDFWDTEKLAAHIVEILSNDVYRNEIVEACKKEMEQIGWEREAAKIKEIYYTLAKN
jgi:glycosyltransferase involved in cell wall biosynthesis